MILLELKKFLKERKVASVQEMALHCNAEPDAVRGMLEEWMRKGKVDKVSDTSSCKGGCCGCNAPVGSMEIYRWC